jgi:hypothetical protein
LSVEEFAKEMLLFEIIEKARWPEANPMKGLYKQ